MKMREINYLKRSSPGSAIAEFVIFTLPFFTVFLFLISAIQNKSMALAESKNLARQSVRAFVTSPNEQLASIRADQVINLYNSTRSLSALNSRPINLVITCRSYPCLSAGNLVTATIKIGTSHLASATEYVDLWR